MALHGMSPEKGWGRRGQGATSKSRVLHRLLASTRLYPLRRRGLQSAEGQPRHARYFSTVSNRSE